MHVSREGRIGRGCGSTCLNLSIRDGWRSQLDVTWEDVQGPCLEIIQVEDYLGMNDRGRVEEISKLLSLPLLQPTYEYYIHT